MCNTLLMNHIRNAILQQMLSLGLTIYQVSKMVKDRIPKRTVYAFLSGEKDTVTKTASILMEALGLRVEVNQGRDEYLKGEKMKNEKPKSFRGRIIAEWKKAGKPTWSLREQIGMSLLIDLEFRIEGVNRTKEFRKAVERNDYKDIEHWVRGLKFGTWE